MIHNFQTNLRQRNQNHSFLVQSRSIIINKKYLINSIFPSLLNQISKELPSNLKTYPLSSNFHKKICLNQNVAANANAYSKISLSHTKDKKIDNKR